MRNSAATRNYDVRMTATPPETEVLAKPTRRKFTAAYKRKIVEEANKCEFGEQAALLRREGLYATQLKAFRKQYLEEGEKGLKAKKRGPKAPLQPFSKRMCTCALFARCTGLTNCLKHVDTVRFATDKAVVQYGFDWDRINVEIGSLSLGDEINAVPLLNTIMAAIAHVQGRAEAELARIRLASPVTDAPDETPVPAHQAAEVIERYQRRWASRF